MSDDSAVVPQEPVTWTPLYDKVVVRRYEAPTEVKGLAVPEAHRKAQHIGYVLKVGNGRWINGILYPLTVQVGDTVLFSKFGGVELEDEEPDLLILREDEILAWRRD